MEFIFFICNKRMNRYVCYLSQIVQTTHFPAFVDFFNANDGSNANNNNNNNTFRMHINKQLTLQKYPRPSYLPSSG